MASPQEVIFHDHIVTLSELEEESNGGSEHILCFLDDFSEKVIGQDITCQLFTQLSRHANWDIGKSYF